MDRINDPTATEDRKFREASEGKSATRVRAPWLNGIQEELIHIIQEEGLEPSAADLTQVQQALDRRFPRWKDAVTKVANVTELRALTGVASGQRASMTSREDGWAATLEGPIGGGEFVRTDDDLSSILVRATIVSDSIDEGTDTITATAHGRVNGDVLITETATNGLLANKNYWVVNATDDTLQISDEYGGAPVDLTGTGQMTLKILTDPLEGVFVISEGHARTGAQGAWVRKHQDAIFNILWFGAKGDGVTDSTAPIHASLKFMQGVSIKGKSVYVPPGTFIATKTLVYPRDNEGFGDVFGAGKSSVIHWGGASGGSIILMDGAVDDEKKIGFSKLSFTAEESDSVTAFDINPTPGSVVVNVSIEECYFDRLYSAVTARKETDQIVFRNNYVLRSVGFAIQLLNGTCSNWFIGENHFRGLREGATAIYGEGGANLVIENNTFQSADPFKMLILTGHTRVSLRNFYAEVAGTHATRYLGAHLTDCDNVEIDKFHTAGAMGTSEGMLRLSNCFNVELAKCKHSTSGYTPTMWLTVDPDCDNIYLRTPPEVDFNNWINGTVTFGAFKENASRPDYIKTEKYIGYEYTKQNIAALSANVVLDLAVLSGSFLITASQTAEDYTVVYLAVPDGAGSWILSSIQETDPKLTVRINSADAAQVEVYNGVGATRTIDISLIPQTPISFV